MTMPLYMDSSVVSVVYGRGMVTGVTPKIYPAARDTLLKRRRTVTRVTNQFHSAANLVTPVLHTRFYIRDPGSYTCVLYLYAIQVPASEIFTPKEDLHIMNISNLPTLNVH